MQLTKEMLLNAKKMLENAKPDVQLIYSVEALKKLFPEWTELNRVSCKQIFGATLKEAVETALRQQSGDN